MDKELLINMLKKQMIEALSLEDMTPEDIDPEMPLFADGLGLDSIDALELTLLMEKHYGIRMEDPASQRNALRNVGSIADYIMAHSPTPQ